MNLRVSRTNNFTFWYGGYNISDVDWLLKAMTSLQRNTWPSDRPVLFDGTLWSDTYREEAAINLMEALKDNTSARSLIVRNVTLDLKAEKAFNNVLEHNSSIQSISLTELRGSHNSGHSGQLGQCIKAVPLSLFKNMTLQELTLQKCTLDQSGALALGQMLFASRSLTRLTLRKVHVEGGLSPIIAGLRNSKPLAQLTLNNMQLSEKDLTGLFSAASVNTSLTALDLGKMNLDIISAPMIARLLKKNKHLTELGLSKNDLNGAAIQVIVHSGLVRNQTLRKLFLSGNPVGDDGAKHLITGLCRNTTLRELSVSHGEIWREGCRVFAEALPTFKGLRKLTMDGNEMEACGKELLASLETNMIIYQVLEGLAQLVRAGPDKNIWIQIDLLLRMNKANRRVLADPGMPLTMLPRVLHSASQPDVLYCLLRGMPGVLSQTTTIHTTPLLQKQQQPVNKKSYECQCCFC